MHVPAEHSFPDDRGGVCTLLGPAIAACSYIISLVAPIVENMKRNICEF